MTFISKQKNSCYKTKTSFKTQNSGYNMTKIPLQHNFPLTLAQNFFENTKFWLQYDKNSLKHKIPLTIAQNFFQNTKFWLQYHKNSLQHNFPVTLAQNFFENTKFWLQYHKTSFKTQNSSYNITKLLSKHKILVTFWLYHKTSFKTQNSGYNITKLLSKHKILVTIIQLFQKTIFSLQCDKNSSRN